MHCVQGDSKVALVTGSTKGIGLAIALALKKSGYIVVTNSRKEITMLSTTFRKYIISSSKMDYIEGDVSKEADVDKIFRYIKNKYGRIDILVNNVGYSEKKTFISLKSDSVLDIIQGNVVSSMLCSRFAIRYMIQQKKGRIINISSTAGLHGMPFEAHYSTAKAALIGLTKSIAKEYGSRGITCNVVAPGVINKKDIIHSEDSSEEIIKLIPLNRMGELKEVAATVVFLASENAAYITGQVIQVDGGLFL